MTPEGRNILAAQEGCKLTPYRDSLGFLTIGRGHLIDNGAGISQAAADFIFDEDIAEAEKQAASLDWFAALDEVRRDVIVNLVFNMGLGGLLTFKHTIQAIKERRWQDAANGLSESRWAEQVGPVRSAQICNAMARGQWC